MDALKGLLAVVAMFCVWIPCEVHAVDRHWNNALGGDFLTDGNWAGSAAPESDDVAVFDLASGGYVVTLSQNAATASIPAD